MRIDLDASGAWLVDSNNLAERLGVATSYLLGQMRRGLVTSTIEPGSEEGEGRSRVTVLSELPRWQDNFNVQGMFENEPTVDSKKS